jgi:hypothetical protein
MNEQAATKLSTTMPMSERERRARRSARAEIAALVLSAAVTAGENRRAVRVAAIGGGATAARRSARRAMAVTPEVLSTGPGAVAMPSVMTPLHPKFSGTIAKGAYDAAFSRDHG